MDGILLVDKAKDWTSHDVCACIRGRFKLKKVGHAGTLDPAATGLLVLLLGKATKSSSSLSGQDKEYTGVIELGIETDSYDLAGKVIKTQDYSAVTFDALQQAARKFIGEIEQMPPMVSAVKHKGVRLYKLARQGVEVEREARKVTVHSLELERKEENRIWIKTHVSKGTYIRTLAHDLGEAVDCCAALAELRRTRSGSFSIEDAVTVEALKEMDYEAFSKRVLPLGEALQHAGI